MRGQLVLDGQGWRVLILVFKIIVICLAYPPPLDAQ